MTMLGSYLSHYNNKGSLLINFNFVKDSPLKDMFTLSAKIIYTKDSSERKKKLSLGNYLFFQYEILGVTVDALFPKMGI